MYFIDYLIIAFVGHRGRHDFGLFEHDEKRQYGISFKTFVYRVRRHIGCYNQSSDIVS